MVAVGQLSLSLLCGLGQAATGMVAIGQLAAAVCFGLGQSAMGTYVSAQLGFGEHVWDTRGKSAAAEEFFRSLMP